MSLDNRDIKTIVREWADTMMTLGKIFAVLGFAVKKADDGGLLDNLEKFTFDLDEKKVIDHKPLGVCPHDMPEATCFEDLGHGFWKCLKCQAIKQGKVPSQV